MCDVVDYFLIVYNILIIINLMVSLYTFSAIRFEHVELAVKLHLQLLF